VKLSSHQEEDGREAKEVAGYPLVLLYAHILFIIEYLIYRNIWGKGPPLKNYEIN